MIAISELAKAGRLHRRLHQRLLVQRGDRQAGSPKTRTYHVLNAVGALFLVMALSRGKASIVAPTTNALAPVLTVLISLAVYQTLPSVYGALGIVLAIVGSTLMVYGDEKRGEVDAEEQAAIANETSDASPGRSEADKPTV